MLGNFALQVDFGSMFSGLQDFENSPAIQPYSQILVPLIALIVVCVFGFIGLRVYKNFIDYAGDGRRMGKWVIDVQDAFRFKVNINERKEVFSEDFVTVLKTLNDIKLSGFVDELNTFVEEGKIHVYDGKYTDREEALTLHTDNDCIIISPIPIDDKNYVSYSIRGERSITSLLQKEYPQVLLCNAETKMYDDIEIPDEGFKDIWVIVPFPRKSTEFGFPDDKGVKRNVFQVIQLPQMKYLAEAVLSIRVLANLYNEINTKKLEVVKLYEQLMAKDRELRKKQHEADFYRYKLQQHKLIGEDPLPVKEPKEETILWFFAGGFFALIGWNIPTQIPQLSGMPPWLGAGIALGIGAVIRYYTKRREEESFDPTGKNPVSDVT